jgi:hypothetical protein
MEMEEATDYVFWCDNCSSQNKNWIIFTAISSFLNNSDVTKSVEIKYLTKGHTYNACDSAHGLIEKSIRRMGNIYDCDDFKNAVKTCKDGMKVVDMATTDFRAWEKGSKARTKTSNLPVLGDVVAIKIEKEAPWVLKYKCKFSSVYTYVTFLKRGHGLQTPPVKPTPIRDLETWAKVQKNILKLIPDHKKYFYT